MRCGHSAHEGDRREAGARRARRGGPAGNAVRRVERVQLDVGRVEQALHVKLWRVRLQERLEVRLVPDLPQAQPRIALRDCDRECGQRVLARRRGALGEAAVGPGRRAHQRRQHRDPARVQRAQGGIDGRPVVRLVARVGGMTGLRGRDLAPVDEVAHEPDAELVERQQVRLERRPRREVRVVLDAELDERRRRGRARDEQRSGECCERELHALDSRTAQCTTIARLAVPFASQRTRKRVPFAARTTRKYEPRMFVSAGWPTETQRPFARRCSR